MSDRCIFFSAGDESGDMHAANLMHALRERLPNAKFAGMGMSRMETAGMKTVQPDKTRDSAMWFHNILRMGLFKERLEACKDFLRRENPALVVLVDFGGFNLCLAKAAKKIGVKVLYYIPPQVWAHGTYRLKKIRKWVDKAAIIYPFEKALYERWNVDATYVGHPIFDELARNPVEDGEIEAIKPESEERVIALFPGSRKQEISANLPILMTAARNIASQIPETTFAMVCPPEVRPVAEELLNDFAVDVALLSCRALALVRVAELCLTKSGTITLEIASQRTPMVICYKVHPLVYFLGKGVIKTPFVGLVNNLAGTMICPEKIMYRNDSGWLTDQALELLSQPETYRKCISDIDEVMEGFDRPGASVRTAEIVENMLED
ncbi:MAG: lipid-A-disaccharide synthase [Candidatus Brocadiia bacterium]